MGFQDATALVAVNDRLESRRVRVGPQSTKPLQSVADQAWKPPNSESSRGSRPLPGKSSHDHIDDVGAFG
jgi:hypothetical protein